MDITNVPAVHPKNMRDSDYAKLIPDSLYELVGEIIGLEVSDDWYISDCLTEEGLCMVHHTQEAKERFFHLRGFIVDYVKKCIVGRSTPSTIPIVKNTLKPINGIVVATDNCDVRRRFDFVNEDIEISRVYDGTTIIVTWYNGKMRLSSNHRLNADNANWGGSDTFGNIYRELNGPKAEDLFDTTKKFSPHSHIFILVHPSLVYLNKQNLGCGYIVYVGNYQNYTIDDSCPYDLSDVDTEVRIPNHILEMPKEITEPFLLADNNLTIEEANNFLQDGFYPGTHEFFPDTRLTMGESIIVNRYVNGTLQDRYQIMSSGFAWRAWVMGYDPGFLHRLFIISDFAKKMCICPIPGGGNKKYCDFNKYQQNFPLMWKHDLNDIFNDIQSKTSSVLQWPMSPNKERFGLKTWPDRIENIIVCLFMAAPLYRQMQVIKAYTDYVIMIASTEDFLHEFAYNRDDIKIDVTSKNGPVMFEFVTKHNGFNDEIYAKILRSGFHSSNGNKQFRMSSYVLEQSK